MSGLDVQSAELLELQARLAEAVATIEAIRSGSVDALVGSGGNVFHRAGADKPYVTFFDAMNEGGVTVDHRGGILHCNPRFATMVGRSVDALRGASLVSFLEPEARDRVLALLGGGSAASCEAVLDAAQGKVPVQLSFTAADADKLNYCCVVVTDLSERAQAEAELRIAAIAFESLDATIVTDASGVISRVNRAFTQLTGYSPATAVGRTMSLLHSGRHDKDFYRALWDKLRANKYWQGEVWDRHQDGRVYPHWLTISAVCTPQGETTHYVGVLSDITKNKEAEAEIHRLAYYDALTGLPNRRLLLDRLTQAVKVTTRTGHYGAVLFLDLDNFKTLNDTRGHAVGDQLLIEVSKRLRASVREADTVARLGGDEFVILLEDLGTDHHDSCVQAGIIAEKVRELLASPCYLGDYKATVSVSIGIAMFHDRETSVDELLKHADLALYQSKDSGRNTQRFFDPVMQASLDERVALELDLRQAMNEHELFLVYQPQVDRKRRVVGAEVLLRWAHPSRGMVPPKEFIAIAEKLGHIQPIGSWVLNTACAQLKVWSDDPLTRDIRLSVNVSQLQFRRKEFLAEVKQALQHSGAHPSSLKIELTESMLIEDINGALAKMHALKDMGVGISIDDFGTGYSSLSYLMRLPIEQLKIDQSFVENLPSASRDAIITQTIIDMAKNLSLDVIAEGVESEEQFRFLANSGCHAFQGYLFSRPLVLPEFEQFMRSADLSLRHG